MIAHEEMSFALPCSSVSKPEVFHICPRRLLTHVRKAQCLWQHLVSSSEVHSKTKYWIFSKFRFWLWA